jgi:hypothetical protein
MRRLIVTLVLAVGMVLGGATAALAHPPGDTNEQAKGFNSEPVAKNGIGHANDKGFDNGIFPGFVIHSPACASHPGLSH